MELSIEAPDAEDGLKDGGRAKEMRARHSKWMLTLATTTILIGLGCSDASAPEARIFEAGQMAMVEVRIGAVLTELGEFEEGLKLLDQAEPQMREAMSTMSSYSCSGSVSRIW